MTFHQTIIEQLLIYRETHPSFNFLTRQRSGAGKRFESGHWFQGNEKYAFVGLINASGGINKTRSVGLLFKPKELGFECTLQVRYSGENRDELVRCYKKLISQIGGFSEKDSERFDKSLGRVSNNFTELFDFLDKNYESIISIFKNGRCEDVLVSDQKFKNLLSNIEEQRGNLNTNKKLIQENTTQAQVNFIVANITWNSKDWKEVSEDMSGHAWVEGDNIPHESWNFDFDNPRNEEDKLFGFFKYTNAPKVTGNNNLIIFYSQRKIVGFYGKTEVLKDWVDINERESYNLIADKNLSVVLPNKIDNIKDKGYLEGLSRVGQVGFSYLKKPETVLNILNEAIELNPKQTTILSKIKQWIGENGYSQSKQSENINMANINSTKDLNQIFFGPPGTGKTYNTINAALNIIDPEFYQENKNDRNDLNKRFKELLIKDFEGTKGQIAFCTFHQSFSYEDFVEGIKPKTNDKKEVYYEIEDGIFKEICQLANSSISAAKIHDEGKLSWDEAQFAQASFYKLSLGQSTNPNDRIIYDYCRDTNEISVGFGDDTDFSGMDKNEINKKCKEIGLSEGSARRLNYFIHDLKKGNYVLVSNGNKYISCLGKVVGDYEYIEDSPIAYHHFRKVEWIFVDENIPVEEVYDTNFNQKTIYQLDKHRLKKEFFVGHTHKVENESKKVKDYILIIDEINRGNVSSIFGELITLIETDKRAGKPEELEVILPYSKQPFKVPHNVHIIGTMNTADKSIEALDTALRRRFSFTEMPPKPKLIETESLSGEVKGIVDGVNLKNLLDTINNRIEKLIDKDHKIGHSYFLKVNDKSSLVHCFKNEVIPLLEEYFFGDYGKIGLILGDSFITKDEINNFEFAEFGGYDADVTSDLKERSVYKIAKSKNWKFSAI